MIKQNVKIKQDIVYNWKGDFLCIFGKNAFVSKLPPVLKIGLCIEAHNLRDKFSSFGNQCSASILRNNTQTKT